MNAQALIDQLYQEIRNQDRARDRGCAQSIREYKLLIDATLRQLESLGYDRFECLEACDA